MVNVFWLWDVVGNSVDLRERVEGVLFGLWMK